MGSRRLRKQQDYALAVRVLVEGRGSGWKYCASVGRHGLANRAEALVVSGEGNLGSGVVIAGGAFNGRAERAERRVNVRLHHEGLQEHRKHSGEHRRDPPFGGADLAVASAFPRHRGDDVII